MKGKLKPFILVAGWILLSTIGCFPQTDSVASTPQITSELAEEDGYVTIESNYEPNSLATTKNPTSNPTEIPKVGATPSPTLLTPDKELEDEVENDVFSITPTPTQVITPAGTIYLRTPVGIARFSLATEELEALVLVEPDWDSLGFALSPDHQQLAYWLHTEGRSELWVTELTQWSPELLFTVSDIEHQWLDLWWLSDQYLVFEPGHFDQHNNFFIPANSYLINVPQQRVEIETGSLIFSCSLAVSPQSNHIATWCPAIEGWTDPQLYFKTLPAYYVVLEGNGEYWLSELAPLEVLVEFRGLPEDIWSWSLHGEYVAFSTYDEVAKERTLYHIDAQSQSLITVEDDSRSYYGLDWSPDQKYISFVGDCSLRGCNKVFDIEAHQVVWTSVGLPGVDNGTYLNWSYDSRYIAVLSDGITIIDIQTGESIRNFKDLNGGVIVWTP